MLIGKPIAQLRPKAGVLSVLYKPLIINPLSIASLFAANTGDDDTTFSISLARQGAADSPEQYLYGGVPLDAHSTFHLDSEITLEANDEFRVKSGNGFVSFAIFGKDRNY